ncbi:MAG: TrkA C-terminal domain-containing protein, partial [Microcystaceae cyanobacterium]
LGIAISPDVKSVFFLLFLFAIGYGLGPQFVHGIASDGASQAFFAVVVCFVVLLTSFACALLGGFDAGFGAGMYAGSQTIAASIGLATEAINGAGLPDARTRSLVNNISIAFAVCYIWGTVGTGLILARLGPLLLGVNLAEECQRYEKEHAGSIPESGIQTAWHQIETRAFQVPERGKFVGMTIAEAEQLYPEARLFVEALRRNREIIDFTPTTQLQAGDIVAVSGPIDSLISILETQMDEVADGELLNIPVEQVNVVLTRKAYANRTIAELAQRDFARGIYLIKIVRGATSVNIPILPQTQLHRGDVITLSGTRKHTDRLIKEIGYPDRPTNIADMITVGLGVFVGGLLGTIVLPVFGTPLTLSKAGGTLLTGLVIGWLRGVYPIFDNVPSSTLWFMNNVGLNMFIAVVGISSGVGFVSGIQQAGIKLLLLGFLATSIPMLLAPLIGKYFFKFDPAINLGCCGGSRTSTA